ncbi:glutaredoxin-like protein C5orf63 homolog isoform X3 [Acinonyx jubatus]|uniref:Glutaredoxin-like protein n=1 Tax=Acinonyx jubatus TaxID=32536 RepID=A0A6J2ATD3_ACIJB|nr:glutaredoxin-like protein C5orf63 homolog isoform X3 [Acinonyx jubatus]
MVPEQAESLFQGLIFLFHFGLGFCLSPYQRNSPGAAATLRRLTRGPRRKSEQQQAGAEVRDRGRAPGRLGRKCRARSGNGEVGGRLRWVRMARRQQKKKRRRKLSVTPRASGPQDPCPLCDEAKEVLEAYKNRFILQEVDITLPENSAWYQRYKFDIPVFHLNGQFLMMHRVDISKLEKQLQKLEQQGL